MSVDVLVPSIDLLRQEYVLVQAWKKTASHVRNHNWYSDTLALDRVAVNLPHFLGELSERLQSPAQWVSDPLRMVPAPKSQQWRIRSGTRIWEPVEKGQTASKLRPLAHVSLRDQVAATALMLCLANRVETIQGDTSAKISGRGMRKKVVSYGNRLFCDRVAGGLRHRWGSGKVYREYYQDYRSFLSRPEEVASEISIDGTSNLVIVQSDLNKFYDRVRPKLLSKKLSALSHLDDDPEFYSLANRVLNWAWEKKDLKEVEFYAKQSDLPDFSTVALPQGLVAAGFFANIALLDFDRGIQQALFKEIIPGIHLEDACRYVDDVRMVLRVAKSKSLSEVESSIAAWLQSVVTESAEGLLVSGDKTRAATLSEDRRPLVRQSRKMKRIQSAISGGFDALGGEEILDAVQGLMRAQRRFSEAQMDGQEWPFSPIPDVRDATVERFAAGRFRSTYRSLRPLLLGDDPQLSEKPGKPNVESSGRSRVARSRTELDDEARAFALGLIEQWVADPSNVRLLRIGLDLWPAPEVLRNVLALLKPFTEKGGRRKAPRRVAWYCLAEIFRAGATETGFVEDGECLPDGVNVEEYRAVLAEAAARLAALPASTLPWYLKQQVLLFLAASNPSDGPIIFGAETKHYRELLRFLKGEAGALLGEDFATLSILARRAFRGQETAVQLVVKNLSVRRLELIAERDPSFAIEVLESRPDLADKLPPRLRDDLSLTRDADTDGWVSLAQMVLDRRPVGPLRNERAILELSARFIEQWLALGEAGTITPSDVYLQSSAGIAGAENLRLKIVPSRVAPSGSMYSPPPWCRDEERWRFSLGYLLRFILTAREDFTKVVRPPHWKGKKPIYRAPGSHWHQRLYGFFNGHSAFGDDWLPISDWTERFLSALLNWPGCRMPEEFDWVRGRGEAAALRIEARLKEFTEKQGASGSVLMLPIAPPRYASTPKVRPLRACIVQTAMPGPDHFSPTDLTLSDPQIRRLHRNHLSSALAAVERMLDLRETHKGLEGRLDWLILPELSVHPRDVKSHLEPFARAHKCIILAGLTYERLFAGEPLVNSAIWVIPARSANHGLQMIVRRQGKHHLAPLEQMFNASGNEVQGFRPCQWLIGYEWSDSADKPPLWLTASICYDATDLRLASDLRQLSDVFAIPALNIDIKTFDQMALALHYHMFQLVIVANSGLYGGSNAYSPRVKDYEKQVFHLHGQPQASMAFLEIDDIAGFLDRRDSAKGTKEWKHPPAGI